jgi:acyl-CoA synthetase (AMP-forming)/AMP-acid ligase II
VAAQIVDRETGQPVASGTEGLLLVKGATLMLGYLNAPEETREVTRTRNGHDQSQRVGVATVILFFIVGALLMTTVNERRGIEAAASG